MSAYDLNFEADEIERHLESLTKRAKAVVRQLRSGKLLGEEDPALVAQRATSLAESLHRADNRIVGILKERRGE